MQDMRKTLHLLESYYTFQLNKYSFKLSEGKDIDEIIKDFEGYKNARECLSVIHGMMESQSKDESNN